MFLSYRLIRILEQAFEWGRYPLLISLHVSIDLNGFKPRSKQLQGFIITRPISFLFHLASGLNLSTSSFGFPISNPSGIFMRAKGFPFWSEIHLVQSLHHLLCLWTGILHCCSLFHHVDVLYFVFS